MLKYQVIKEWAHSNIGKIITGLDFNGISKDDYLDMRDQSPFDTDWSNSFDEVETLKASLNPKEKNDSEKLSETIRHDAFTIAIRQFGSADLAGYLSDDFGLITDALAMGMSNQWINGLMKSYLDGIPPMGVIPPLSITPINI